MTDNNHPITPPQELVQLWLENYFGCWDDVNVTVADASSYIAAQTSEWIHEQRGADIQKARDEELEACCEWLDAGNWKHISRMLRAARRPKPPSLAEEALKQLSGIRTAFKAAWGGDLVDEPIRRALERLQELEERADG